MSYRTQLARSAIGILLGLTLGIVLYEMGNYRSIDEVLDLARRSAPCQSGLIYAGISSPGHGVVQWSGSEWIGAGKLTEPIRGMVAFEGALYAAMGSRVERCGEHGWEDTHLRASDEVSALATTDDRLFAATEDGGIYRWSGSWEEAGTVADGVKVESVAIFAGNLYAGAEGSVFRMMGSRWELAGGPFPDVDSTRSLAAVGDRLYASVERRGVPGFSRVYEYQNGSFWADLGPAFIGAQSTLLQNVSGTLYAAANAPSEGRVLTFENGRWNDLGSAGSEVSALSEDDGVLLASAVATPPHSTVFKLNGAVLQTIGDIEQRISALVVLPR